MFACVAHRECVFFSDEDKQDYKQEVLKQSVRQISSQMTKLTNIISHIVDCDDVSGKFSSFPIDIKGLARNSDDSVLKEAYVETNCYERIPTGYEIIPTGSQNVRSDTDNVATEVKNVPSDTGNVPTDAENVPSDPEKVVNDAKNASTDVDIGDRNPDIIPNDAEIATASAEGTATGGDDVAKMPTAGREMTFTLCRVRMAAWQSRRYADSERFKRHKHTKKRSVFLFFV